MILFFQIIWRDLFTVEVIFLSHVYLEEIYKTIGIKDEKYKKLINSFDKALSLNPKELANSVSNLQKEGYDYNSIGDILIKNPYLMIKG